MGSLGQLTISSTVVTAIREETDKMTGDVITLVFGREAPVVVEPQVLELSAL